MVGIQLIVSTLSYYFLNFASLGTAAAKIMEVMNRDFKEAIIQLMQHPLILKTPINKLSLEEGEIAYDILNELIDFSMDESYTLVDCLQMARLELALGELSDELVIDRDVVIAHFRKAFYYLDKGGIDLSMKKWAELISLRTVE